MISIITPTYNSEKNIINAIRSVIRQNYDDYEHIIIDNLSTDKTIELIKYEYRNAGKLEKLKVVSAHDKGISDAFNKGINLASGEIIGILNSDDSYYNNSVLSRVKEAFRDSKILIVHGNIYFSDDKYGSNIRRPLLCNVQVAMPYNHPGMFIRKSVYETYGVYDLNYKVAMDYELICRLHKNLSGIEKSFLYLDNEPLVTMNAGGISWKNELRGIEESKRALINNRLWNFEASKNYFLRIFRFRMKGILTSLGWGWVVRYWRNYKWRDN